MNGQTDIDTLEATEHLKNILNVGKSESESGASKPVSNGSMDDAAETNLNCYQKVEISSGKDSSHVSIYGNDVDVYSSPLEFGGTSNQIIVEHLVDYGWEEKYHIGNLISIHVSGKYMAYILKPARNNPGFVRVVQQGGLNKRCLIRDYKHEVKDVAFAHYSSQTLLGSVDACGELFVHKVHDGDKTLTCDILIHITHPDWTSSDHNRIIWCMYIPDDNDAEDDYTCDIPAEDAATLLVVTHDEKAEICNVQTIIKEHGFGSHSIDEITIGIQVIAECKMTISAATFSPDGSALALGSLDGVVKFFQVNTLKKDISPKCLHQWTPHPKKSLSSIYFLDNLKNHRPDEQFWKFAITGAENNTELKIWSCETWSCLQTIKIHSGPNVAVDPCLKAEMDLSSKYLFLSDIKRKLLMILFIEEEPLSNKAFVRSLSEFKVPLPVLSLAISTISFIKYNSVTDGKNSDDEDLNIGDALLDSDDNCDKLMMKFLWINTKTLQSCRIIFKPNVMSPLHSVDSISSLSQDSYGFKDGLSDVSLETKASSNRSSRELDMSLQKGLCVDKLPVSSPPSTTSLTSLSSHINFTNSEVLLTPDDFTSPSHTNIATQNTFSHEEQRNSLSKCDSVRLSDGIDSLPVESGSLQRRKSSQHSATSSPSREVAEILSPNKGLNLDEIVMETPNLKIKEDIDNLSNTLSSFGISTAAAASSRNQQEYMKEWPQAPDPSKDYQVSNLDKNEMVNHNKCFLGNQNSEVEFHPNTENDLRMDELLKKMDSLCEAFDNQKKDIMNLQTEIKNISQDQNYSQQSSNLSNKLDHVVSQHIVPGYNRIENLIIKSYEDDQRNIKREMAHLSNNISSTCGTRLDNTLKQEISSCILPQMNRVLDTVASKLQLDLSQRLGAVDSSLKESVIKHVKGKAFVESLSQNISSSLTNVVQTSCKEVFQTGVVPAFEQACQVLFHQLNESFQKGILEYMHALERHGASGISSLESASVQLKEIQNIFASTQQMIHTHSVQMEKFNMDILKFQDTLSSNLRAIINEEVRQALKEQTILNSRSVTPLPCSDPMMQKQQLLQLVKQGNINEAFQQALSAMDVQLVLFLCESVSIDQVFGTPCPLQQHVLLSLVNQLSADLPTKTEIKVQYIQNAIACLDANDSLIKDHIRSVLDNLEQRIFNFYQKFPSHKCCRSMKILSLAIRSIFQ